VNTPLVLASASPRRRQLLDMLGLEHRVVPPDVDESRRDGEDPAGYVLRLAEDKARAVAAREPAALVLAADTTVVLGPDLFGKPATPAEAADMLRRLSGRTHQVYTGVALAFRDRIESALDVSDVTFRPLDAATIAAYVATGEPMDKAGAYAIQGRASKFVDRVEGCYFNVIGLPLAMVYRHWKRLITRHP